MAQYRCDNCKETFDSAGTGSVQCPQCHWFSSVKKIEDPEKAAVAEPVQSHGVAATPTKKRCAFCGEEILEVAIKCKHCGEKLSLSSAEVGGKPFSSVSGTKMFYYQMPGGKIGSIKAHSLRSAIEWVQKNTIIKNPEFLNATNLEIFYIQNGWGIEQRGPRTINFEKKKAKFEWGSFVGLSLILSPMAGIIYALFTAGRTLVSTAFWEIGAECRLLRQEEKTIGQLGVGRGFFLICLLGLGLLGIWEWVNKTSWGGTVLGYKDVDELTNEERIICNKPAGLLLGPGFYPTGGTLTQFAKRLESVRSVDGSEMRFGVKVDGNEVSLRFSTNKGATSFVFNCSDACIMTGCSSGTGDVDDINACAVLLEAVAANANQYQPMRNNVNDEPNFISVNGRVVPNPKKRQY